MDPGVGRIQGVRAAQVIPFEAVFLGNLYRLPMRDERCVQTIPQRRSSSLPPERGAACPDEMNDSECLTPTTGDNELAYTRFLEGGVNRGEV